MQQHEFEALMATAIKREIEAKQFYHDVEQRVENEEVKTVFSQLAKEEMGHMELLEKFKADQSMVMKIAAPAQDAKVAEATELPALSIDMKPADAIALAMKKEQQAVEFYKGLAEGSNDAGVKEVFDNLANMELSHKNRLENVFVQIGYPEVF